MRLAVLAVLLATSAVDGADFCDLIRCSDASEPVCASNGVTFTNTCLFQIAKCRDATLTLAAKGECVGAEADPTTFKPNATTTSSPTTAKPPGAVCEMMCMDLYQPVCGSDGKTYDNQCKLQLFNCNKRLEEATHKPVTIASSGACGAAAGPGTVTPPTNGSDADTNANATTPQPARDCEVMCPMIYKPVCASDGKTYSNSCEMRREGCYARSQLTQVSEGECVGGDGEEPAKTTKAPAPPANATAAPTNTTTPAPTSATPAATTKAPPANATTPAPTSRGCPRACAKIMKPVCGSNGETYNNKCEFENAKCTLKIAGLTSTNGECPAKDAQEPTAAPATNTTKPATTPRKCSTMCTDQYQPVCGSNGKTYTNKCFFNVAKCQQGTLSTLAVASEGECTAAADADSDASPAPSACPRVCTKIMKPVCGSNGETYNNQCEFENAKCTLKIAGLTANEGECAAAADAETPTAAPAAGAACPRMCASLYKPVCGSNGETYSNQCEFENAKCTIKIANLTATEGECAAAADADVETPTAAPAAGSACPRMCASIYKPMCGSDGITYSNQCEFENAKCTKRIANLTAKEGECA